MGIGYLGAQPEWLIRGVGADSLWAGPLLFWAVWQRNSIYNLVNAVHTVRIQLQLGRGLDVFFHQRLLSCEFSNYILSYGTCLQSNLIIGYQYYLNDSCHHQYCHSNSTLQVGVTWQYFFLLGNQKLYTSHGALKLQVVYT